MKKWRPICTPMAVTDEKPPREIGTPLTGEAQFQYRTVGVGGLQYLRITRSGLLLHKPNMFTKRILRYVKGTSSQRLKFLKSDNNLNAYFDTGPGAHGPID